MTQKNFLFAAALVCILAHLALARTAPPAQPFQPTPFPFSGVAGVATQAPYFIGFPIGVTSGTYDQTFNTLDSSFYNPAFLTANGGTAAGAEAAFAQALDQGKAYFNIHTENFGSGEIRGFLHVPDAIPTMVCLGMGLIGLEMFRRKFGAQLNA